MVEVDPRVPRAGIRFLVGRVHVSTPDEVVEADIRGRIREGSGDDVDPDLVRACVDYALLCHHNNQGLFEAVMSGRL